MNRQLRGLQQLIAPPAATRGRVVAVRAGQLQVATASGTRFVPAIEGARAGDDVTLREGAASTAPGAAAEVYWL